MVRRKLMFLLLATLLGGIAGPPLCEGVYTVADRLWPHAHSSATASYLWGGIGGAFLAEYVLRLGVLVGSIGFAALASRFLFRVGWPALTASTVLLLGDLIQWQHFREGPTHLRLLLCGFPFVLGLVCLLAGLWKEQRPM